MRIHKWLSDVGALSRRKAEEAIAAGRVTVNGRPAVIGQDLKPGKDTVAIDGVPVAFEKNRARVTVALNKPRGYVSTMTDELGRRCVADLLADVGTRVYPVGRLDRDSEGLLLCTNDGELANLLMHPSREVGKTYRVTIAGAVNEDQLVKLATGVDIGDYVTAPAQAEVLVREPGRTVLRITLHEGKNRQVRRMCEAVGLEVARLRRVSVGPVRLGMLSPGTWRALTAQEVAALRAAVKTPNLASLEAERAGAPRAAKRRPPRAASASGKPAAKRPAAKGPAAEKKPAPPRGGRR